MLRIRLFIQHYSNPLHVYCRLRGVGVSGLWAGRICRRYEWVLKAFKRKKTNRPEK